VGAGGIDQTSGSMARGVGGGAGLLSGQSHHGSHRPAIRASVGGGGASVMIMRNTTMRVALVTAFPREPERPRGGVEAVSVNLARALARQGDLDLHVITTDQEIAAVEESGWECATIHRLPRTGRRVL